MQAVYLSKPTNVQFHYQDTNNIGVTSEFAPSGLISEIGHKVQVFFRDCTKVVVIPRWSLGEVPL